jgi:hypothetical protein
MSARIRSVPPTGTRRRHRLGIGLAVAVGAGLSAGATAEALAVPALDASTTPAALRAVPAESVLAEGDAVASALAEVVALQDALDRTAASAPSRLHPDDPATQALNAPADRASNPVGADDEVEVVAAPEPAEEPTPAPEPEPEPEPAAASQPAATGSSGVPRSTWQALAACESNGDWTIDTGNSFYGGLQFNLKSWNWAGGQRFAAYPHHASKDEQIAVAEVLLDIHPAGWGAWPACSAKLGLR